MATPFFVAGPLEAQEEGTETRKTSAAAKAIAASKSTTCIGIEIGRSDARNSMSVAGWLDAQEDARPATNVLLFSSLPISTFTASKLGSKANLTLASATAPLP
eukprot:CAMPEP_0171673154 /NCGR_PEP_ID=MMETSP0990-20121206/52403_1 /TAXON_ID=483369 /ORGANISM="non described non described, Strain CCMP2098" /LENGTH=102 /DNA_ID=CAMNT_0012258555 /DNA_START=286 /DNA_END=591 /DNA_ORIENTATION=+